MLQSTFSKITLPLLILILILGGFLRFYEIERRGPSFFDDGIYTLEGKWICSFSKILFHELKNKFEEIRLRQNLFTFSEAAERFKRGIEGEPPVWGRPGFSLLTALCMGLIGSEKMDATNVVSAFWGTLSILGVFLLARVMFSEGIALMAAFLIAISGYHLVYSVTGLADGSAMCIGVFAFYCYYKSLVDPKNGGRNLWVFLSGFTCGLAFTVHDRFLYLLLVIFINEGIDGIRKRNRISVGLKRVLILAVTFFIPLILFEFPYYLAMVVLRHFQEFLPFRTYFEELFSHHIFNLLDVFYLSFVDLSNYPEFKEAGSHFYNFFTYPYLFWKFNGPVFCVMFLGGTAVSIIQRRYEDRLLILWLLLPFVLFSVGLATSVRYALVFMPAVTIIAARSLWIFSKALTRGNTARNALRGVAGGVFLLLVMGSSWYASRDIRAMRCAYDDPVEFLKNHGTRHISSQYPVTKAYLGVENVKEPPSNMEQLREYYQEGFRYYLVDYRKFFMKPPSSKAEMGHIIEDIESTIRPVFSYEHPCYTLPCYVFEVNLFFRLTLEMVRDAHKLGVDQIRIYDLKEYFAKKDIMGGSKSPRCFDHANTLLPGT